MPSAAQLLAAGASLRPGGGEDVRGGGEVEPERRWVENSRRRGEAMPRRSLVQKRGAKLLDHRRPSLTGDPALRSGPDAGVFSLAASVMPL